MVSSLSPFSEFKQVFFHFISKRSISDRGRPALASSVPKIRSLKAKRNPMLNCGQALVACEQLASYQGLGPRDSFISLR